MKTKSIYNSFSMEQSVSLRCILLNSCRFCVCIPECGLGFGRHAHTRTTATESVAVGTGTALGAHLNCALHWRALSPIHSTGETTPRIPCSVLNYKKDSEVLGRVQLWPDRRSRNKSTKKVPHILLDIGLSNFCLFVFPIVNATYNTVPDSFCS